MKFNHLTQTYDFADGTTVPIEHVDTGRMTMLDLLYILILRDKQRKENYED